MAADADDFRNNELYATAVVGWRTKHEMKKTYWIGIAGAVIAAVAVVYFYLGPGVNVEPQNAGKRSALLSQRGAAKSAVKPIERLPTDGRSVTNKTGKAFRNRVRGRIGGDEDGIFRDSDGNPYPPKDQELMRQIRDAIDNDDLEGARALAEQAVSSDNVELRSMAVEALAWFGKDSLVELTQFMADADKGVSEAAKAGWIGALQELDDDGMKAGAIEASMKSIRDSDMLEDVSNELIGIDELAAVQVLADIIVDGTNEKAISAAKETYNSITGEDWSGIDAAEDWLQENYDQDDQE